MECWPSIDWDVDVNQGYLLRESFDNWSRLPLVHVHMIQKCLQTVGSREAIIQTLVIIDLQMACRYQFAGIELQLVDTENL